MAMKIQIRKTNTNGLIQIKHGKSNITNTVVACMMASKTDSPTQPVASVALHQQNW